MITTCLRRATWALALGLAAAAPARANDSTAAIGIGGLALTRSEAIRLDQEELFDSDFLTALDRRRAARRPSEAANYSEVWLQYVLRSGANWAGPIRDFRLVIDKGNPRSLLSFCGTGVRRLDDRRFEVRYRDFTPDRDLDILIIDFAP